ncbi:hypothetical protein EON64_00725 [archaeon]|nr:MAG: hypothetical protein EON64_00725 [archaeon]
MIDRWGPDFYKKVLWSGGSAGTIFAVGLALGKSPEEISNLYKCVAERASRHGAFFYGSLFMEEAVRELISDPLSYKLLEGRCCIGTTSFFDKHRWHVSWTDNEDLVHTVKSSCHIPFYCQSNYGMGDAVVVDGAYGFAGTALPHGDHTLYVGIDPHAEITRHFSNEEMMYPTVGQAYEDMVLSGYRAFQQWDGRMIRKVTRRKPNYHALYILWVLKALELGYHAFIEVLRLLVRLLLRLMVWVHSSMYGIPLSKEESAKAQKKAL